MAKKTNQGLDELRNSLIPKKTETQEPAKEPGDKNTPVSVYLTREEKTTLNTIAKEVGLSRHALMQYAIKEFIERYQAGEIKAAEETRTVTVLKSE